VVASGPRSRIAGSGGGPRGLPGGGTLAGRGWPGQWISVLTRWSGRELVSIGPRGQVSLDIARVWSILGPRRAHPPRAHHEVSESDNSTHEKHQQRERL